MADTLLFWQIVPVNDNNVYIYKDKGGHHIRNKTGGLPPNDLLLFDTEEECQAYINEHFHPTTHIAQWIIIGSRWFEEWKRENSIVPNDDCGECPVWLADAEGPGACAECPLRKEYLARFQ